MIDDWDAVYAHIAASTGWTWEQVGQLTIPRLNALNKYWKQNPPVHLLVKWFIGYESKDEKPQKSTQDNDAAFAELFSMFPTGQM